MEAHPSENDLIGRTVRMANRLENISSIDELHILDVEYTVSERGFVTGVTLVLTVGGPDIRVQALSGTVRGTWGSSSHTTHFDSEVVEQYAEHLADRFEGRLD